VATQLRPHWLISHLLPDTDGGCPSPNVIFLEDVLYVAFDRRSANAERSPHIVVCFARCHEREDLILSSRDAMVANPSSRRVEIVLFE
jgi:hypothetical protein